MRIYLKMDLLPNLPHHVLAQTAGEPLGEVGRRYRLERKKFALGNFFGLKVVASNNHVFLLVEKDPPLQGRAPVEVVLDHDPHGAGDSPLCFGQVALNVLFYEVEKSALKTPNSHITSRKSYLSKVLCEVVDGHL